MNRTATTGTTLSSGTCCSAPGSSRSIERSATWASLNPDYPVDFLGQMTAPLTPGLDKKGHPPNAD